MRYQAPMIGFYFSSGRNEDINMNLLSVSQVIEIRRHRHLGLEQSGSRSNRFTRSDSLKMLHSSIRSPPIIWQKSSLAPRKEKIVVIQLHPHRVISVP